MVILDALMTNVGDQKIKEVLFFSLDSSPQTI